MRRLPPLNGLKAFEACARLNSFTGAADELCVTQAAISRHVRGLEDYLGVQLFHRSPRRLELTDQGMMLLPVLTESLDRIARTTEQIQERATDLFLKLQPTFALRWLIPRLGEFQAMRPDIRVRLSTSWRPVNFAKESFDAGVVCSAVIHGYDDTINRELVLPEPLTPICSPEILKSGPPLRDPRDLFEYTLLHSSNVEDFWRLWFSRLDVSYDLEMAKNHQYYDLLDTAIHGAINGHGVALTNPEFVKDEIRLGRLVMPFEDILLDISAYYFVYPKALSTQSRIAVFRKWLLSVAQE